MLGFTALEYRTLCRNGVISSPSCDAAPGYVQANLVILERYLANDFEEFCKLNPKACPILEILKKGPLTTRLADRADIRTDLPKYRIYKNGVLESEVADIRHIWPDEDDCNCNADSPLVAFLIGCSFTFDDALVKGDLMPRHIKENRNVPMYRTNLECTPFGTFQGNLVVSMRPYKLEQVDEVVRITERFPSVHGGPIAWGDHLKLGIEDLSKPIFGDVVTIEDDEIPVFWACGATPQLIVMQALTPFCITHSPGHMLVCDIRNDEL